MYAITARASASSARLRPARRRRMRPRIRARVHSCIRPPIARLERVTTFARRVFRRRVASRRRARTWLVVVVYVVVVRVRGRCASSNVARCGGAMRTFEHSMSFSREHGKSGARVGKQYAREARAKSDSCALLRHCKGENSMSGGGDDTAAGAAGAGGGGEAGTPEAAEATRGTPTRPSDASVSCWLSH